MIRIVGLSYILLLAGLVFGLYHVSYQTNLMEEEARRVSNDIQDSKDSLGILQAEWSARTAPDIIDQMTRKLLPELRPTSPEQIVRLGDLPMQSVNPDADGSIEELLNLVDLQGGQAPAHPRL